ncbi:hypothetical protein Ciccas_009744 [Cichlidogyrus casuarinus]|uniref:BACK domain-containing protein n=1 Tax=Cichlidogyrus casuarinus TaxID=1844966 RepID=A0ABD2PW70_9PLAT
MLEAECQWSWRDAAVGRFFYACDSLLLGQQVDHVLQLLADTLPLDFKHCPVDALDLNKLVAIARNSCLLIDSRFLALKILRYLLEAGRCNLDPVSLADFASKLEEEMLSQETEMREAGQNDIFELECAHVLAVVWRNATPNKLPHEGTLLYEKITRLFLFPGFGSNCELLSAYRLHLFQCLWPASIKTVSEGHFILNQNAVPTGSSFAERSAYCQKVSASSYYA